MGSAEFHFRQFTIRQPRAALRVGTDGVLLGAWVHVQDPQHILDVGTGTGLIALMMAQRFPHAAVHAVEIEEGARFDASENFSRSPWADRVRLVGEDIHDFAASHPKGSYDLIVCNPPYFRDSLTNANRSSTTARHQESLRIEQLLGATYHLLAPQGTLSLIYPFHGLSELQTEAEKAGFFLSRLCAVRTKPDKSPSRSLTQWTTSPSTTSREEHVLMQPEGRGYSAEHLALTKAFYLRS